MGNLRRKTARRYIQKPAPIQQEGMYNDLDKFLFDFDTPTTPSSFPDYPVNPPGRSMPQIATEAEVPLSDDPAVSVILSGTPPMHNEGGVWATPFDSNETGCILFYKRRYPFFTYAVPDQFMLKVQHISYELGADVPEGTIFLIHIFRDNELITSWKDMVINAGHPNSAHRYALAGHTRQLPMPLRLDKKQQLTVHVELVGPLGSNFGPNDSIVAFGSVNVVGFQSRIAVDNDGAPKGHVPRMTSAQPRGTGQGMSTFGKSLIIGFLRKLRKDNRISDKQQEILTQWEMDYEINHDGLWYPR